VIGRRPYLNGEAEGTLLIESHSRLHGQAMSLDVQLDDGCKTGRGCWNLSIASLTGQDTVKLPFESLAADVTADMSITMAVAKEAPVTIRRRFSRLAPLPTTSTVIPTVIDHRTRGLLVGGKPYFGLGAPVPVVCDDCVLC